MVAYDGFFSERNLAKSPVGEWGMTEIHKAQHATPQKSFGTGTLAEKILENILHTFIKY
jgi:hypothetical protein